MRHTMQIRQKRDFRNVRLKWKKSIIEQLKMARQSTKGRKSKRAGILAALAKNISAKGEIAEDRLLNKSDKVVDIITAYVDTKLEDSGLPMIMGIEMATLLITGIIDLIPIPGDRIIGGSG